MIQIDVTVNFNNVLESLLVSEKQNRFAIANAINSTMKIIQFEQRVGLHQDMIIRKKKFMERQIAIIKPFASPMKNRLWAMVSIGRKPRLRLSQFETGGMQYPMFGQHIAVPVTGGARPVKTEGIPHDLFISRMNLHRVVSNVRGMTNRGGVFVISGRGIFLRQGKDLTMLYSFLTEERINKHLKFYIIAIRTTNEHFPSIMREQVVESMRHTMRKGANALAEKAIIGTLAAKIFSSLGEGLHSVEDMDMGDDE